jgi:hypothetical protein
LSAGRPPARNCASTGHPSVIYVQADETRLEAVREVLPQTINPANPGQVLVTRPSDALAAKRATQRTYAALFLGLAAVALLVGGVGVANTMVVSVLERRHEIGLCRALGANRGQIRGQFLGESAVLAFLGGDGPEQPGDRARGEVSTRLAKGEQSERGAAQPFGGEGGDGGVFGRLRAADSRADQQERHRQHDD